MEYAARTHIGLVRQVNQDSYAVVSDLPYHTILIVADGMGGHSAGEVASTLASQVVAESLRESLMEVTDGEYVCDEIASSILKANSEVFNRAGSQNGLSGMGTTIVAAVVSNEQVAIGHIGDSRAYLLNHQELIQLTEDHSLVNELVKSGQIEEAEAMHHPQRNVLLRALGTDLEVEVDTKIVSWNPNDILLLCSDGVWNLMDYETLRKSMMSYSNMKELVDVLIKKALDAGGVDNITLVAIKNDKGSLAKEVASL